MIVPMRVRCTQSGTLPMNAELASNPVLPEEILNQAVPGNLRRADTFVKYLQKLVYFLKARLQVEEVVHESPTAFLHKLDNEEEDFSKPMKFVSDRLRSLLRTLEVTDVQDFSPLMLIADFATLVATFQQGEISAPCCRSAAVAVQAMSVCDTGTCAPQKLTECVHCCHGGRIRHHH